MTDDQAKLPTREERAERALKNGLTRAREHMTHIDHKSEHLSHEERVRKAMGAAIGGAKTAEQWLNGTHPLIHRARPVE